MLKDSWWIWQQIECRLLLKMRIHREGCRVF
jgi:hypothetical protein